MKISHEEYIERMIISIKTELDQLVINHRIDIAKYEVKKENLHKQLDSLERQLS